MLRVMNTKKTTFILKCVTIKYNNFYHYSSFSFKWHYSVHVAF